VIKAALWKCHTQLQSTSPLSREGRAWKS